MEENKETLDLDATAETEVSPTLPTPPGVLDLNSAEETVERPVVAPPKGIRGILNTIASLLSAERITPRQAREMRLQFGISNGYFTRKTYNKAKQRKRNKIARRSRRVNRQRGHRGVSNRKGQLRK